MCVGGGQGWWYVVLRFDVSMICDEYLYDLKVTFLTGPVEGCPLVLTEAAAQPQGQGRAMRTTRQRTRRDRRRTSRERQMRVS